MIAFINLVVIHTTYYSHSIPIYYLLILIVSAAAAAAKSLQSCPTLCNPIDGSPPGSPISGILQARALEWVAISFSKRECKKKKYLLFFCTKGQTDFLGYLLSLDYILIPDLLAVPAIF